MGGEKAKEIKGRLKRALAGVRRFKVKKWMLFVALIPLLFIDATLLRADHIKMTELRGEVLAIDAGISENESADEAKETDEKLSEALTKLKEFTFSNIVINVIEENGEQKITFGTGPFYLEHQYLRAAHLALETAEEKLSGDDNPYGNVYGEAGETCRAEAISNGWTWDSAEFINCMLTEIQKYPAADEIQDTIIASLPSTELFRHNYASPIWAPTFAGFMILITILVILVLTFRIIYAIIIRIALVFV